jgi:hypothetical protein
MKFSSKTFRAVSLSTILTVIVGANVQQAAQAFGLPFGSTEQTFMPCSAAFFSDPDFMYDIQATGMSVEDIEGTQAYLDELAAIDAEVTTFMVERIAPIGYVANKVDGVAVEIPAEIEQAMQQGMAYPYSREKVKVLNEKYGEYATFGQQISLVYSTDQLQRIDALQKAQNARIAALLTPEQKREQEEVSISSGTCSALVGFIEMGLLTKTIEVGVRPDLDARLREDTTGAVYFR